MSNIVFKTGMPHQERTAIGARRRLADKVCRCFSGPDDQDGVLFADGVGLGKTWEAIAAAALILCKAEYPQKGRRHVLILCPANLITKWEDELSAGSPLRKKLDAWAASKKGTKWAVPAQRVLETLTQVFPIRSAKHVQTKLKYGKFHPPGGTYIISQSLIVGQSRRLAALRKEEWDIVIVDEAHNAAARKALLVIQKRRRARTKLLLTATPFQLEPRQLNTLAKNLVKRGHKVLNRPEIARYLDQLSEVFECPDKPSPNTETVKAASNTLRKLAARSVPRSVNRCCEMLMLDGTSKALPQRLDSLDDHAVQKLLSEFRQDNEQARDLRFELVYFEERLRLAVKQEPTYVATRLRRLLAAGIADQESPRLRALAKWARTNFLEDIRRALRTGLPHKTLLFTAWVGKGSRAEAAILKELLAKAFADALDNARRQFGGEWSDWTEAGRCSFESEAADATATNVAEALRALRDDELTSAIAGKHVDFAPAVADELRQRVAAIKDALEEVREIPPSCWFEARSLRRRVRDMQGALSPWTNGSVLGAVERYTGNERRTARDRVATAFRGIGPPWVLVASNVGSEGIDLHTYTARIIHYDLEWNPAKMEQREGRGDRVGRRLWEEFREKLAILYCLVPRTYDERMFHQLVARERWHGVLLGKPAIKLADEGTDASAVNRKRIARMRLDLAPRRE